MHTPDSSRYWQADSYLEQFENGVEPDYFDKEFIRIWIRSRCNPYEVEELPKVPEEICLELIRRYAQIFRQLTGQVYQPDVSLPILQRIERNLKEYIAV